MLNHVKLSEGLRKKYGGDPRALMRRLGLDENGNALKEAGSAGGISGAHAAEIMDHLKGKLSAEEMSELNLFLDHLLGEATVAANDDGGRDDGVEHDDEERRKKMREFLKSRGMADNFVERAVDMLPRPRRAADRAMARDTSVDMTAFDKEFGGSHIIGSAIGADMALDRELPRRSPVPSDQDLANFNSSFPESTRLG
jgi:hypothetical protein